ncbi:putative lipid II flippase FtsW [Candidatus Methylospira mobilis]|uniref:Probable peptidoglycan glycosyltransferase FtsW n=1 Tax=Candidatus Methylospira mobilis TaxID=1808979 RepID=A0A5Q0BDV8_9GAMM|nr:putative lipid II flippase FtsW [Candidatus Methylospira mobilis]QFY42035.1 putative lipid II flippase FtsW [Candidatus Methylospira mobilis]WNV03042.1 putative lipid II flippase FtsW [Candidatus Methylospira mobilis]
MNTRAHSKSRGLVLQWKEQRFYVDTLLLTASLGLLLFGYIMVTSASLHLGEKLADDSFYFPKHQLIHIAIGLAAALMVASRPLEFWQKWSIPLLFAGMGLLVIVLVPGLGKSVNGSVRWLNILGLRIQVSEVFKLVAVIFMSSYITRRLELVRRSVTGVLYPLALLGVADLLLLKEPDFGSVVVVMATALGMLFLAGARMWLFIALMVLTGAGGSWLIYSSSYRLKRVLSFIDPWADPLNSGFQLTQALIAFGRGEWFGVGLGSSVQKLFYLPEAHTDFLFSVIGEELGLLGASFVILLFCAIVWRAFVIGRLAARSNKLFASYLAYGLGIWFGLQAIINMGVNMGMLPTKGLTLPLMSYGGGSMIMMSSALAILFRIRSEVVGANLSSARSTVWLRTS